MSSPNHQSSHSTLPPSTSIPTNQQNNNNDNHPTTTPITTTPHPIPLQFGSYDTQVGGHGQTDETGLVTLFDGKVICKPIGTDHRARCEAFFYRDLALAMLIDGDDINSMNNDMKNEKNEKKEKNVISLFVNNDEKNNDLSILQTILSSPHVSTPFSPTTPLVTITPHIQQQEQLEQEQNQQQLNPSPLLTTTTTYSGWYCFDHVNEWFQNGLPHNEYQDHFIHYLQPDQIQTKLITKYKQIQQLHTSSQLNVKDNDVNNVNNNTTIHSNIINQLPQSLLFMSNYYLPQYPNFPTTLTSIPLSTPQKLYILWFYKSLSKKSHLYPIPIGGIVKHIHIGSKEPSYPISPYEFRQGNKIKNNNTGNEIKNNRINNEIKNNNTNNEINITTINDNNNHNDNKTSTTTQDDNSNPIDIKTNPQTTPNTLNSTINSINSTPLEYKTKPYMALESLTHMYTFPGVIDIKMGQQSWGYDAKYEKMCYELIKSPTQSLFGFRLVGANVPIVGNGVKVGNGQGNGKNGQSYQQSEEFNDNNDIKNGNNIESTESIVIDRLRITRKQGQNITTQAELMNSLTYLFESFLLPPQQQHIDLQQHCHQQQSVTSIHTTIPSTSSTTSISIRKLKNSTRLMKLTPNEYQLLYNQRIELVQDLLQCLIEQMQEICILLYLYPTHHCIASSILISFECDIERCIELTMKWKEWKLEQVQLYQQQCKEQQHEQQQQQQQQEQQLTYNDLYLHSLINNYIDDVNWFQQQQQSLQSSQSTPSTSFSHFIKKYQNTISSSTRPLLPLTVKLIDFAHVFDPNQFATLYHKWSTTQFNIMKSNLDKKSSSLPLQLHGNVNKQITTIFHHEVLSENQIWVNTIDEYNQTGIATCQCCIHLQQNNGYNDNKNNTNIDQQQQHQQHQQRQEQCFPSQLPKLYSPQFILSSLITSLSQLPSNTQQESNNQHSSTPKQLLLNLIKYIQSLLTNSTDSNSTIINDTINSIITTLDDHLPIENQTQILAPLLYQSIQLSSPSTSQFSINNNNENNNNNNNNIQFEQYQSILQQFIQMFETQYYFTPTSIGWSMPQLCPLHQKYYLTRELVDQLQQKLHEQGNKLQMCSLLPIDVQNRLNQFDLHFPRVTTNSNNNIQQFPFPIDIGLLNSMKSLLSYFHHLQQQSIFSQLK